MKKGYCNFLSIGTIPVLMTLLTLLSFSIAYADGGIDRNATSAEKEFYKKVIDPLIKAIPGPQGWELVQESDEVNSAEKGELKAVPEGIEKKPFFIRFEMMWKDAKRLKSAQDAFEKTDITDPAQTELMNQLKKYNELFDKAIEKNDTKEIERISGEMGKIDEKFQDRRASQEDELEKNKIPRDTCVIVTVMVNDFQQTVWQCEKQPSIEGCQVYRSTSQEAICDTSLGRWLEGSTWMYLGNNWKLKNDGYGSFIFSPANGVPYLTVQAMVVQIEAEPERAKQMLQQIDWASLKKLIKQDR